MLKSSTLALLLVLSLGMPGWAGDVPRPDPPPPGYGEMSGAYMGIDVQEVTTERMQALKLKEERGAEITMVDHDAPAGKAGLREHDVILEFNGAKVEGTEELRRLIHETPPGRNVQLLISRDGQPMNISLQLADKKQYFAQNPSKLEAHEHAVPPIPPIPPMPPMPPVPQFDVTVRTGTSYGLVVDNLTPQLGEYFGVKNGEGVLVKSVEKGSPAETAGFRAGDVIVRVDKTKIIDRGDWRSALRSHRTGKVAVGIVRDRREQNLTLNLPESARDHSSVQYPSWDFDLDLDLPDLQARLEELRPEIERARMQALEETRKALESSRKEMRSAAKQAQKAMDLNEKELHRAIDQARIALDHEMKEWQKDIEKAQRESKHAEY